jgi:nucleoside-diphosphate-sugar epimerase
MKVMFADNLKGEVFNLGNPEEYQVKDLAEKIKALTGSSSAIASGPLPEDDPTQRKPDITKIKTALGWEPRISVDEGLKKTIEFYKK